MATRLLDPQQLDRQATADLRGRAAAVADQSEILLRRSAELAKPDQMLLELFVRGRLSHRRIAALLDLPHGTVARRLKRLGTLLHDPLIARLVDGPCPLERTDRQIAIGYFLQRRSLRQLAAEHGQPLAQISRRLQFVRGWFRGASARGNAECRRQNAE